MKPITAFLNGKKISELFSTTGLTNGHTLIYNSSLQKFEPKPLPEGTSTGSLVQGSGTNGKIVIDGVETQVYTHPSTHSISEVSGLQAELDKMGDPADLDWLPASVVEGVDDLRNWLNERAVNIMLPPFNAKGNANYYNSSNKKWYVDSGLTQLATDDSAALQAAIDYAKSSKINRVFIPYRQFLINATVNLPSNITIEGQCYEMKGSFEGSTLVRTSDVTVFKAQGESILAGNAANAKSITINNLKIKGNDLASDLVQFIYATDIKFNNVFLFGTTGRAFYAKELMDSRFTNFFTEWCGSTDGTLAAIELESGNGGEFSNEVHFIGNRHESYRGTALRTVGLNVNELFFTDCKFESVFSNNTHLEFNDAVAIHLNGVNICSKGSSGSTLPQQIKFTNCTSVSGALFLEHTGTIDTTAAKINKYVYITGTSVDIELYVHIYNQNGANTISPYPVQVDSTATQINIRGGISNSAKRISNREAAMPRLDIQGYGASSAGLKLTPLDITNEYWELGRVVADAAGSKAQFIHGSGGSETVVFDVGADHDMRVRRNLFVRNFGFHPAQLGAAPWAQDGTIYTDTSVTPSAQRTYLNGDWRRVAYGTDPSTATGSWKKSDIYYNTLPVKGGYVGWVRLTTGTGQVIGTDWQPFGAILA